MGPQDLQVVDSDSLELKDKLRRASYEVSFSEGS